MRKRIIREGLRIGEEEIIDIPEDRHQSRNVDSKIVGKNKEREEKLAKRRKK